MEGNLSAGNLLSGSSYGVMDQQGSIHVNSNQHHSHTLQQHRHPHQNQSHLVNVFPLQARTIHDCNQIRPTVDYKSGHRNSMSVERGKTSTSEEDEPSFNEEDIDGRNEVGRGKKVSPWHRMKWTDGMVRLLITIVSYIGEDAGSDSGSGPRRKFMILQKKGKWKSVSKVMAVKGFYVSPQQCEDKFNDLNKRYKRLTDVLGRGTSCKVVENPALLALMDHLSEKTKEDVRKILSSKHLFYEEMCSYHNANRLHLPIDAALQQCLQSVLKTGDARRHTQDDMDEDEQEDDTDERDDQLEESGILNGNKVEFFEGACFPKRMKSGQDLDDGSQGCNRKSHLQNLPVDMKTLHKEDIDRDWIQRQWMERCLMPLEQQKFSIQVQAFELEKQRLKWQRFSRKKDRELDKLRMENERMKLENEHMALELKRKELDANYTRFTSQ